MNDTPMDPDAAHGSHRPAGRDERHDQQEQLARHAVTTGDNIVLNDARFEGRPEVRRHLANLLDEVGRAAQGRSEDEIDRLVRDALDRSGLRITEVEISRFVENLVRTGRPAAVSGDDGQVLAGNADATRLQRPRVGGDADPDHPDRPAYA